MKSTKEEINTRKIAILKELSKCGELMVEDIAQMFKYPNIRIVSQDIDRLHEDGLVQKIRGGVRSKFLGKKNTLFESRSKENSDKKESIADYVISNYLIDGNLEEKLCIFLDGGSTIEVLFRKILQHKNINETNFKFVTNNVALTDHILPSTVNLYLSGGRYLSKEECLIENASSYFKTNKAKYCFLSAGNVSFHGGLLGYNSSECEVKRSMIMNAEEIFILIDDSKFKLSGGELIAEFQWEKEGDKNLLKAVIGEERRLIKIITNNCKTEQKQSILEKFSENSSVRKGDVEEAILFAPFEYEENLNLFDK